MVLNSIANGKSQTLLSDFFFRRTGGCAQATEDKHADTFKLTSVKTNRGTEESKHPSDQCRICQCDFNVKFVKAASQPGTTGYVSSENLFKPSKTKETYGQILADICRVFGKKLSKTTANFQNV